jgi:pectinacetylesterase
MSTRTLRAALFLVLAAAPAGAQWQTIEPGGDTVCSDGSPYRFFVHPGDPARLLVEFEGGGGCWSAETCAMEIYTRRVTTDPELARRLGLLVGIYDRGNPENPFREWTHVYIPYCTGDLHWGNSTRVYAGASGPYTIQHKGAVNAAAALRWASENVLAPSQVAVAGCSAGGYGSIVWAPQIMTRYSGASVFQLSDSAAGVVPPGFFTTVLASWDVSAIWPKDIPPLALESLDPSRLTLPDLYTGIAGHYPLSTFSQMNALTDSTQTFFYGLTRGNTATADDWSAQMQASVAAIKGANANFAAYTAPGSQHCFINTPSFYTTSVNGVRLVDWVGGLVSGRRPASVP